MYAKCWIIGVGGCGLLQANVWTTSIDLNYHLLVAISFVVLPYPPLLLLLLGNKEKLWGYLTVIIKRELPKLHFT